MSRFDISSLMTTTSGYHDVWTARFSNMRYAVPSINTVTVNSGFEANLPALAEKYMGDQNMWWILLQYNGLIDPIHDIRIGQVLKIPDRTSLISYLERQTPDVSKPSFQI
jgi:hypothetical protein